MSRFGWRGSRLLAAIAACLFAVVAAAAAAAAAAAVAAARRDAVVGGKCDAFLAPIWQRREACLRRPHEVDICLEFAYDYHFLIPFLVHHLALGVTRIWIYSNDPHPWANHPTIECLQVRELITVLQVNNATEGLAGLNHCFRTSIPSIRAAGTDADRLWGVRIDVDEFLVLHSHTCLSDYVETLTTGALGVPWAIFVPSRPWNGYALTGQPRDLPTAVRGAVLPHLMAPNRTKSSAQIKSIVRLSCLDQWSSNHYPDLLRNCPYSTLMADPQGRRFEPRGVLPHETSYGTVQLNHYYALSLSDFLRKAHRGYNRTGWPLERMHPQSQHFAALARAAVVPDRSFVKYYGALFTALLEACPVCLSLRDFPPIAH